MSIKNILYLTQSPFSIRDYNRFGIEIIVNNNFKVQLWDLSPLFGLKKSPLFKIRDIIAIKNFNYKIIHSKKQFYKEIEKINNTTLIINIFGIDFKTAFIFKKISKLGIPYAIFSANILPIYSNLKKRKAKITYTEKIISFFIKIKSLNIYKINKKIFQYLPSRLLKINPPDYILAGGKLSLKNSRIPLAPDTKVIWGHSLDYDLFLIADNRKSQGIHDKGEYAVFVDSNRPFHPNYLRRMEKPSTTPKNYFPSLCRFFSKIEEELNIEIVIAAHPSSNYAEHEDFFEGRKIYKFKTIELIRDCKFAIMHYSTSLNFAVLYFKPVIFITTREMEKSIMDFNYIRAFSMSLNKGFINIDKDLRYNWKKELRIDKDHYKSYKENYIKISKSQKELFWQIVADNIK
jgi:hypothetical protein